MSKGNNIWRLRKSLTLLGLGLLCSMAWSSDYGLAYITNQDNGVTVLDLATLTPISNIDVKGVGPRGLALSDDGKWLVVATRENGSVSLIERATQTVVRQIPVGKNPEFVRIKGNFAFVSYEPSAAGLPPAANAKPSKAKDKDDDDDKEPARIGVIDLQSGQKVREIVGGSETEGIEFSADGKQLIITNEADNTVTVHEMTTGKNLKTIHTEAYGNRPRGIKVSPDGETYIVTLEYGNKFMVLDKQFKVIRTVDTGITPYGVAFDRKGERIFVATNRAKTLEVYDAKSFARLQTIPSGERCWHFSFTPDESKLLLACGKSNAVLVLDAHTMRLIKKIDAQKSPWGIVTYPHAMGSLDEVR